MERHSQDHPLINVQPPQDVEPQDQQQHQQPPPQAPPLQESPYYHQTGNGHTSSGGRGTQITLNPSIAPPNYDHHQQPHQQQQQQQPALQQPHQQLRFTVEQSGTGSGQVKSQLVPTSGSGGEVGGSRYGGVGYGGGGGDPGGDRRSERAAAMYRKQGSFKSMDIGEWKSRKPRYSWYI